MRRRHRLVALDSGRERASSAATFVRSGLAAAARHSSGSVAAQGVHQLAIGHARQAEEGGDQGGQVFGAGFLQDRA
jgi:hypothetical protein